MMTESRHKGDEEVAKVMNATKQQDSLNRTTVDSVYDQMFRILISTEWEELS